MAAKKGFFQKTDQKKQYSQNVLDNVESAYRPKNKARVRNPISSNTMSGEEADDITAPVSPQPDSVPQSSFRKPVDYAFAGPQAKRRKNQAQSELAAPAQTGENATAEAPIAEFADAVEAEFAVVEAGECAQSEAFAPPQLEEKVLEKLPEPEIQVRTGKPLKKKTNVTLQKTAPKKSKKLSQPEIQVFTGNRSKKLSPPEIQVRTGRHSQLMSLPEIPGRADKPVAGPTLETSVAFDLLQAAIMLAAMQELEVDVQKSKGNYEPVREAEIKVAKSLGFQKLFNREPARYELQYELDLDSIAMDDFRQTEIVEQQQQQEMQPVEFCQKESGGGSHFLAFSDAAAIEETPDEVLDATPAQLFEEPSTEEVSAAELGLSFDPQAYGKDKQKTQVLNVPKQGIKRSHRGTIEAVFQPNGNIVQAQYNRCGILIEVTVGGAMKLTRAADTGKWTMSYLDGSQPVNRVNGVAFDRLGNLCYSTEDGRTIVICADGRVIEK